MRKFGKILWWILPALTFPVSVSAQQAQGTRIKVSGLSAKVEIKAEGKSWQLAAMEQALEEQSSIRIGNKGATEISYDDGATVQLGANTKAEIPKTRPANVGRFTTIDITRGWAWAHAGSLNLKAYTPSAIAQVRSGPIFIKTDEKTTWLSNLGNAPLWVAPSTAPAGKIPIAPGSGVQINAGQPPSTPEALGPAPSWVADMNTQLMGVTTHGATGEFAWQPVAGATAYHLTVSKALDGTGLVTTAEYTADTTHAVLHHLPGGKLYARISASMPNGFESQLSPAKELQVWTGTLAPKELTDIEQSGSRYNHQLPPEPVHAINGVRWISPQGVTCAVGNQDPKSFFVLRASGPNRIRCSTDDGKQLATVIVSVSRLAARLLSSYDAARGKTVEMEFEIVGQGRIPDSLSMAVDDYGKLEVISEADRIWKVKVTADKDAPNYITVLLRTEVNGERVLLGSFEVAVATEQTLSTNGDGEEFVFDPESTRKKVVFHYGQEAAGLVVQPNTMSLRNFQARGQQAWVGVGWGSENDRDAFRGSAGLHGEVLEGQLQLEAAGSYDFSGSSPGLRAGGGDVLGTMRWVSGTDKDLSMALDLSAHFPTSARDSSLSYVRAAPSLMLVSNPFDRWMFRGRLGALVDANSNGVWGFASAYGADYLLPIPSVVGLLSVGAEMTLNLGSDNGFGKALALGGGFMYEKGPFHLHLGARGGLSDEAQLQMGTVMLMSALQIALEPEPWTQW